jgi:hypothetical protein
MVNITPRAPDSTVELCWRSSDVEFKKDSTKLLYPILLLSFHAKLGVDQSIVAKILVYPVHKVI